MSRLGAVVLLALVVLAGKANRVRPWLGVWAAVAALGVAAAPLAGTAEAQPRVSLLDARLTPAAAVLDPARRGGFGADVADPGVDGALDVRLGVFGGDGLNASRRTDVEPSAYLGYNATASLHIEHWLADAFSLRAAQTVVYAPAGPAYPELAQRSAWDYLGESSFGASVHESPEGTPRVSARTTASR